jgi:probable phosphoglycerate mutase
MTRFLLIRHGSTATLGSGIAGWKPGIDLTAGGVAEVRALAHVVESRPVEALYTSPLERTCQTAAILAEVLGREPTICEALGELRFGRWTGLSFEELNSDPQWRYFNTFRSGTRIPDGELMLETQARVVAALLTLRDAHPAGCVALVTHGDVIKAALTYLLGMPLDFYARLEIAPASLSEFELGEQHVCVHSLNRTA